MLSPEDEDLFEDITEEELIEFAGEMSISSELWKCQFEVNYLSKHVRILQFHQFKLGKWNGM